jgi:hypothetical protein
MAEQTPENNSEQGYRPAFTDWRGLIVLAPMADHDMLPHHRDALQQALDGSAHSLFGTTVSQPEASNTLEVHFYMGDVSAEAAVSDSIASICLAVQESRLGDMELVAMQAARQLDLEIFGEDYFTSDNCYVGQFAYDTYRSITDAHDSLGRFD